MSDAARFPLDELLSILEEKRGGFEKTQVELVVLTAPSIQSAWKMDGDYSRHSFGLAAIRNERGVVEERTISAYRLIDSDRAWPGPFAEFAIRRVRGLFAKDRDTFLVIEFDEADAEDPELARIAARLREPVVVERPPFGPLMLDRRRNQYEGRANWNGAEVELILEADANGSLEAAFATADALWSDQAGWKSRVETRAIADLLQQFNRNWRDPDVDDVHSTEQFLARMNLSTIRVDEQGAFAFWYGSDDMFGDHDISVEGTLAEGPMRAEI